MNKIIRKFKISGILFFLFFVFTLAVKTIDVSLAGETNTKIGFASLNQRVFDIIGVNMTWYHITQGLGIVAFFIAIGFAGLGLWQLVKKKQLWEVDKSVLVLGGFYIGIVLFYLFFEKVIINYRPIMMDHKLEASYPSSHTFIILFIMSSAILQAKWLLVEKGNRAKLINGILWLGIILTVVGRLLSGVHWFTDIVGGVLLSAAMVVLYEAVVKWIELYNIEEK